MYRVGPGAQLSLNQDGLVTIAGSALHRRCQAISIPGGGRDVCRNPVCGIMRAATPHVGRLLPAVAYVRMSTDAQDYSIPAQQTVIADYAAAHGMFVVHWFKDEGISGLTLEARAGLQGLLAAALTRDRGFEVILIYDVSRWGRFQDPDQAAHYEFICRNAGLRVEYCAEQFENDGSTTSSLFKQMKRTMAAEFSRELSVKVKTSKDSLRAAGFWMGGNPGFGYRRQMVRRDGEILGIAEKGERNQRFANAHTRLILGPVEEQLMVRRIYELYLRKGATMAGVAAALNRERADLLQPPEWSNLRIRKILIDPKYAGRSVAGRRASVLGKGLIDVPPDRWVHTACPAIVTERTFRKVQTKIALLKTSPTDAAVLDDLRRLLREHGHVGDSLIRKHGRWSPMTYCHRFGSVAEALRLIGYEQPFSVACSLPRGVSKTARRRGADEAFKRAALSALEAVYRNRGLLNRAIIDASPEVPSSTFFVQWFGTLSAVYAAVGYVPNQRQVKLMGTYEERASRNQASRRALL